MTNTTSDDDGAKVDRLGIVASTACTLHCVVCALAPGIFAAFGLTVLLGHNAEWVLSALAGTFAIVALVMSLRRSGPVVVSVALGTGLFALILARWMESVEAHGFGLSLGLVAGFALVAGHLLNVRALRR